MKKALQTCFERKESGPSITILMHKLQIMQSRCRGIVFLRTIHLFPPNTRNAIFLLYIGEGEKCNILFENKHSDDAHMWVVFPRAVNLRVHVCITKNKKKSYCPWGLLPLIMPEDWWSTVFFLTLSFRNFHFVWVRRASSSCSTCLITIFKLSSFYNLLTLSSCCVFLQK